MLTKLSQLMPKGFAVARQKPLMAFSNLAIAWCGFCANQATCTDPRNPVPPVVGQEPLKCFREVPFRRLYAP